MTHDVGTPLSEIRSPRAGFRCPNPLSAPTLDPRSVYRDRVVVFGDTCDTASLLHLATVRSDDVLLVAAKLDQGPRRTAERLGVAHHEIVGFSALEGAACLLVPDGRTAGADAITAEARSRRIPVFVSHRPALSVFTLLDFIESRSCTLSATGPPVRGRPVAGGRTPTPAPSHLDPHHPQGTPP